MQRINLPKTSTGEVIEVYGECNGDKIIMATATCIPRLGESGRWAVEFTDCVIEEANLYSNLMEVRWRSQLYDRISYVCIRLSLHHIFVLIDHAKKLELKFLTLMGPGDVTERPLVSTLVVQLGSDVEERIFQKVFLVFAFIPVRDMNQSRLLSLQALPCHISIWGETIPQSHWCENIVLRLCVHWLLNIFYQYKKYPLVSRRKRYLVHLFQFSFRHLMWSKTIDSNEYHWQNPWSYWGPKTPAAEKKTLSYHKTQPAYHQLTTFPGSLMSLIWIE